MAKIKKLKNGLELICDCGVKYVLTTDENDEIVMRSEFKKNNKINQDEPKKEGVKNGETEKSSGGFFRFFAESDEPSDEPTDEPTDEPRE